MPNTSHAPGLLGANLVTGDGTHMYHASLSMVVAHTSEQKLDLEKRGYQEEYIPQEYPKVLALELSPGNFTHPTVKSKEEETIALSRVAKPALAPVEEDEN